MFGVAGKDGPHLVRGISNIKSVEVLSRGNHDTALSIASADGQTLLLLESDKEGP
jgi:hypothetical protein